MGELVVDVISFQKIFGLCALKCHIMEIWRGVTLVHGQRTTECEDRARILETEFAKNRKILGVTIVTYDDGGNGKIELKSAGFENLKSYFPPRNYWSLRQWCLAGISQLDMNFHEYKKQKLDGSV